MKIDSKDLQFGCALLSKDNKKLLSLGLLFLSGLRRSYSDELAYKEPSNRFYPKTDNNFGVQIQRECLHITVKGSLDRFEPWSQTFEIKKFRGDSYWGFHLRSQADVTKALEVIACARTKEETAQERQESQKCRQVLRLLQGLNPEQLAAVLVKANV